MSFKITILGSSGALPAHGRFPSSQLIEIQNRLMLVDAGEGVQQQLMRFQLSYHRISHIFISHLHGDHYLGLTGLLFTMHLQRRSNDLHLYSQTGLDEIILAQLRHSRSSLNYRIIFHTLTADAPHVIMDDEGITVTSFPLMHKIPCTGFLFKEKIKSLRIDKEKLRDDMKLQHIAQLKTGKDVYDDDGRLLYLSADFTLPPRPSFSYAYCSDTAFLETLPDHVRDVDLLYHEATFMEADVVKTLETMHSTAKQAAQIAKLANAKALVIGHFSARYSDLEPMLAEAREIFPATTLAIEGQSHQLEA